MAIRYIHKITFIFNFTGIEILIPSGHSVIRIVVCNTCDDDDDDDDDDAA